jgi:hypothetical protein
MDYNNPNDYWFPGYDPYKGMDDEERLRSVCGHVVAYVIAVVLGLLLCALLGSCTTTKYVPVTETRTEHHWHTDSLRQRDSTHTEHETIIRELDSAAMARYGIQMESNQRAWLVLQREMENRLRELEHTTAQRDTVRDSIPVPYPVEKVVPRERSTVEWVLLVVGVVAIAWEVYRIAKR